MYIALSLITNDYGVSSGEEVSSIHKYNLYMPRYQFLIYSLLMTINSMDIVGSWIAQITQHGPAQCGK